MSLPDPLPPRERTPAVASLISSRAVYAYNWYTVGPIQGAIAVGLAVTFDDLSLALWVFLLGVAAFQIPAGTLSLRWGARRVTLLGAAILSGGALLSAAAPSFDVFLLARFVVGLGAALFFSPGIGLVSRYYHEGGRGWGIGLFNGAFSLGAAITVYSTVILEQAWGWRGALLTAGVAMLLVTLENVLVLPRLPEPKVPVREALTRTRGFVASGHLWGLSLALVGFWSSNFLAAQYVVPWAETVHGWTPGTAGLLDAVLIACPLVGAPVGGALTQRSIRPRLFLGVATLLTGLSFGALPVVPSVLLAPWMVFAGVASGMGTGGLYYLGSLRAGRRMEDLPLSVGFINFLQVILGAFIVLGLGYLFLGTGTTSGYTAGWLWMAAATILPIPLLLGVRGLGLPTTSK